MISMGMPVERNVTNSVCQEKNILEEIVIMKLESASLVAPLDGLVPYATRNAMNYVMRLSARETVGCVHSGVLTRDVRKVSQ